MQIKFIVNDESEQFQLQKNQSFEYSKLLYNHLNALPMQQQYSRNELFMHHECNSHR